MKIIKIAGGLGNQMFQYAFSRELGEKNREEIFLDSLTGYKHCSLHNGFELQKIFNIKFSEAPENMVKKLSTQPYTLPARIRRKYFTKHTHYIERYSGYVPSVFDFTGNKYYEGYWQSEKYFSSVREIIKNDLKFKHTLSEKNLNLLKDVVYPAVSIHIRRGDYLVLKNQNLNICNEKYYQNALSMLLSKTDIKSYLIFSDDIPWCKENFRTGIQNFFYIDWNKGNDSWQDMALMSLCSHNIIANSSFSWWGAWLNPSSEKIVIAPELWDKRELKKNGYYSFTSRDIIPSSWHKVQI